MLKSDVLFRDICLAEAKAAGVSCNDKFIDALALDILQNPARYDVIVTTNIFGDILVGYGILSCRGPRPGSQRQYWGPVMPFSSRYTGVPRILPVKISPTRLQPCGVPACFLTICGDHGGSERIEAAVQDVLAQGNPDT